VLSTPLRSASAVAIGVVAVAPAAVALLFVPLSQIVLTLLVGAAAGGTVVGIRHVRSGLEGAPPGVWRAAALGAGCALAVAGTVVLLGVPGLAIPALVACLVLAVWWHRSRMRGVPLTARAVAHSSTARLCAAWRRTGPGLLMASPARAAELARLRALYLDEFERRDPAGFVRWLSASERSADDPERFIGLGS
jgi:hypothetical protein